MELGGNVAVKCEKTGYSAELEFKLKVRFMCRLVAMEGSLWRNYIASDLTMQRANLSQQCRVDFAQTE